MAKGFLQVAGFDYLETFSHVVKFGTIIIILIMDLSFHWHLRQLDINNASLNGTIIEEVFIKQVSGFLC